MRSYHVVKGSFFISYCLDSVLNSLLHLSPFFQDDPPAGQKSHIGIAFCHKKLPPTHHKSPPTTIIDNRAIIWHVCFNWLLYPSRTFSAVEFVVHSQYPSLCHFVKFTGCCVCIWFGAIWAIWIDASWKQSFWKVELLGCSRDVVRGGGSVSATPCRARCSLYYLHMICASE